ncbi:hypothetical protein [Acidithiobacillus sp.]|uniref:hypothetical protein n=1 Tax=Acidithiobacillus sp. TaxID=1872118 RepID=UPI0025C65535|nr:hypothetical protein [Acidithiobacillus sp.]MCK9188480.1 hypothetical protein [Acidithiobacillus sp.]MCK9358901.1 hypothetical protein [Acidithiobacillus sp.]
MTDNSVFEDSAEEHAAWRRCSLEGKRYAYWWVSAAVCAHPAPLGAQDRQHPQRENTASRFRVP